MRVRMISGVKRVTVLKPGVEPTSAKAFSARRTVFEPRRGLGSFEPVKFAIIDRAGRVSRGEVHLDLGGRKKQTGVLKPIERGLRRYVRFQRKLLTRYLDLHERSNHKRRNGWAKDIPRNMVRAIRSAT